MITLTYLSHILRTQDIEKTALCNRNFANNKREFVAIMFTLLSGMPSDLLSSIQTGIV
jgi:hypothetical protein